jgi:hypothetical protein
MILIEPVKLNYSNDEIHQQLEKIFADPIFAVSDILKRFLAFIADETLEGRTNQIKEYTIGLNVLHKPFEFNPKQNAIVRIHAGRLRRALRQYYKNAGTMDPIHICIPTGCYVPQFSDGPLNARQDTVAKEVHRVPLDLSTQGIAEDCLVTGDMQYVDDRLQMRVQMINKITRETIWSQVVEYKINGSDVFDVQQDLTNKLVSTVGDYCRLIKQHMLQMSKMSVA